MALKRLKVTEISTHFSFELGERPDRIVLDPDYLLLDEERADNVWR